MKSGIVPLLLAAVLLAGCGDSEVTVAKAHHRNHVSPPSVEPPSWPADSFDQAAAVSRLAVAREALEKGDAQAARQAAEESLRHWPVAIEAWEVLIDACQRQNDEACRRYAVFYHAKLLVLSGLPMRAATLGFETIAENPEGAKVDDSVYDRRTLDMAERLWVFCSQQDPAHNRRGEPMEEAFYDAYPYAPALLVIGVGAGLLTGIKSIANK